jgi:polysaccharide deacetylase family protein (PEP-CTERM system associated)
MNILTLDIEEWFHINDSDWTQSSNWKKLDARVEKNTKAILNLLAKHNQKATLFIMGWIAEEYPDMLKEIAANGHEIGYHSYYHMRPKHQNPQTFEEDLQNGLKAIEEITKQKVEVYRAPNLSLDQNTLWILPILLKNGIKLSSSTKAMRQINGINIPNQPFIWNTAEGDLPEFPLNRQSILGYPLTFTGSGYFRLFPLWFTNYLYHKHSYNNGYFHPNDIDANVPTPKELGIIRNWLNTVGSARAIDKLDKLLSQNHFFTVSQAWHQIKNQEQLYTIQLP